MGFFDKFVTTYSQGYQQKRAESRAQEDSERDVRLKMYQAALADDTLTDDERHHILNEMGEDTGYKHDPKIFGLFAPPGHIGHQKGPTSATWCTGCRSTITGGWLGRAAPVGAPMGRGFRSRLPTRRARTR